jgi:hypothetical protein
VECNDLARAVARIGHDVTEFVSIFGGLEQIELNGRFVLAADLFADEDKAAGCGPGPGFPLSFEEAEPPSNCGFQVQGTEGLLSYVAKPHRE